MDSSPHATPVKSTGSRWTEPEKVDLLLRVLDSYKESIKWRDVSLPPGRTEVSCQRLLERLRLQVAKALGEDSSSQQQQQQADESSPAASPKKRNSVTAAAAKAKDSSLEETPTKKKRATKKLSKIKAEDSSDDAEVMHPGPGTPV